MTRLMSLMLAGMIMFIPNQLHFPTTFGVRGLNSFNLVMLAALLLLPFQPRPAHVTGAYLPPLTSSLLLFYIVLGLAVLVGIAGGTPDLMADLTNYKTVVSYSLLYFVAFYGASDLATIRRLFAVLLFVFLVASVEAIHEGITYGFGNYAHGERASGPFGHGSGDSNYAGVFYGIFASFALTIALLGKRLKPLYRLAALGCYAMGGIAIFATYSRQSFLIIGVTTLLLALRKNVLVAVVAVCGMLSYPMWAPEGVVERIGMTMQETATGATELESSAASRYELWGGAIEIVKEHPFGVGFNQFSYEIEPYLPDWIVARDAQNQYFLIAAEAGLQGLLAFIILLAALFRLGIRVARRAEPYDARVLGSAFVIATVAVVLGNIYSSTFFSGELMGDYWIMAGLLSKYALLAQQTALAAAPAVIDNPLENVRGIYARWQAGR